MRRDAAARQPRPALPAAHRQPLADHKPITSYRNNKTNVDVCSCHACSVPVKSAEMRLPNSTDWEWVPHSEGRWQITSPVDPLAFPLPIRLTSVLGDVVTDTIDSSLGGQVCERNEEKDW